MRPLALLLFVIAALGTSACLSASRGDEMQAEIAALRAEQDALTEQLRERERSLAEMVTSARSETESLGSMIEQAKETLQRNDAATGIDLQAMRDELNGLRGAGREARVPARAR